MSSKQTIREQYVTRGAEGLAEWHRLLRHVTFACALVLMSLSLVALHWALELVGIPPVLAWVGPVFLEAGMAATASAATTIRKSDGRYYVSLWVIFSFLMALAQAANIGHAIVSVEPRLESLPAFVPAGIIYGFAAAFAALFPLGGTLFVHVSGFLRAHSVDADWVDPNAQTVRVASDGAPVARAHRAPARAPQPEAERARTTEPARAPKAPTAPVAAPPPEADADREAAYARYADHRRTTGSEWSAAEVAEACGVSAPSQGSRIRSKWRERFEADGWPAREDLDLAAPATIEGEKLRLA